MAVYTDISDVDLTNCLLDYDIGTLLSYKGIAEGVENTNFLLKTTQGSFILTLYEKRVNQDDLPFFLGLMEHLAAKGLNCPLPVHRNDGTVLSELSGRPAAIITFLDGMWLRKPNANHCFELGQALAQMHISGQDFTINRENALAVKDWHPLWLQSHGEEADKVEAGLSDFIDEELSDIMSQWPKDLPHGVIHADLFPDNVFFIGDELSGLIDFYFACNDLLMYDVSICLNAWCFEIDGAYNITKGRALLRGYQSVRPFEADEITALPILCRGSAMRFFLTRIYDWIYVSDDAMVVKKDPREYLRKLRFHKSIDTATEYGIDA